MFNFWYFFFRLACAILQPNRVRDAVEWISIPLALSCNLKKCFQVNKPFIFFVKMCDILMIFFIKLSEIYYCCLQIISIPILPDGTPCKTGFCNKGFCEPTMTDIVVRIWGFFEDFNISSVMRFLKVSTYIHNYA